MEHEKTTDNKKFPCKNCGAFLTFEPGADSLKCQYCGEMNEIEIDENFEVIEEDFEAMLAELSQNSENQITVHQIKCDSCGALSTLPENVTSADCPFCGSVVVLSNEAMTNILKPKYLIPFKISEKLGRESFKKWVKKLFWAPRSIKTKSSIEKLTGVYIPYWTYDSQTETSYRGERGDNYTVTVQRNGKNVTETRIRWTYVSGHVSHFFDDVLIAASNSLPKTLSKRLINWNYDELVPFKEDFLSGFRTEIYQTGLEEGFGEAKTIMQEEIKTLIKQDIGGDHQRIGKSNSSFNDITFKHILLPIWISSYRYKNKRYNILINGQNGNISGTYPKSFWKIFFTVLIIVGAIALLIYYS